MSPSINNGGIIVTVALVLLSFWSFVTQKEGVPVGHQTLFWGAFFAGCAMLAWFAKYRPQKDVVKVMAVITRRRVRQWL